MIFTIICLFYIIIIVSLHIFFFNKSIMSINFQKLFNNSFNSMNIFEETGHEIKDEIQDENQSEFIQEEEITENKVHTELKNYLKLHEDFNDSSNIPSEDYQFDPVPTSNTYDDKHNSFNSNNIQTNMLPNTPKIDTTNNTIIAYDDFSNNYSNLV